MSDDEGFHLAQLNVALPLEPLTSARLAEFVALLEPVNALADGAPGFVWRLQTEDGDATAVRAFDDDRLIVNLTVWESLDALAAGGRRRGGPARGPAPARPDAVRVHPAAGVPAAGQPGPAAERRPLVVAGRRRAAAA